jgi:hypothetical protein
MEFNLQKTIENSFMNPLMGQSGQRLSSTPAIDYVNPGIGAEINMFSFYVPTHSIKSIHSIEKVHQQQQEGSGNIISEDKDKSSVELPE